MSNNLFFKFERKFERIVKADKCNMQNVLYDDLRFVYQGDKSLKDLNESFFFVEVLHGKLPHKQNTKANYVARSYMQLISNSNNECFCLFTLFWNDPEDFQVWYVETMSESEYESLKEKK
jgi:hypothetical protein